MTSGADGRTVIPQLVGELVPEPCNGDALARQRTIAVVLRLVMSPGGELSHGEIVDVVGRVGARFPDWEALVPALRAWLEREGRE